MIIIKSNPFSSHTKPSLFSREFRMNTFINKTSGIQFLKINIWGETMTNKIIQTRGVINSNKNGIIVLPKTCVVMTTENTNNTRRWPSGAIDISHELFRHATQDTAHSTHK